VRTVKEALPAIDEGGSRDDAFITVRLALVSTRLGLADCPDFSGVARCNHFDCFFLARLIGKDVIWDLKREAPLTPELP
jgi:hypothetical protein